MAILSNCEELCVLPHTTENDMTSTIHLGYFPWKNHFPSSHYSTIKHEFSYSTKHLPVRDFTIRGTLWSSSIFTSYKTWQNNNESYLHQTILGPLPKLLCYGAFFKGWHQWQPTLINNNLRVGRCWFLCDNTYLFINIVVGYCVTTTRMVGVGYCVMTPISSFMSSPL